MSKLRHAHLQIAKDYCKSEREIPFTMAQGQHQVIMQQASNSLKARRLNARASCWLKIRGHDMSDERIPEKIKKIQPEQLGPDRYSQELEMMAVSLLGVVSWSLLIAIIELAGLLRYRIFSFPRRPMSVHPHEVVPGLSCKSRQYSS